MKSCTFSTLNYGRVQLVMLRIVILHNSASLLNRESDGHFTESCKCFGRIDLVNIRAAICINMTECNTSVVQCPRTWQDLLVNYSCHRKCSGTLPQSVPVGMWTLVSRLPLVMTVLWRGACLTLVTLTVSQVTSHYQ